MSNHSLVGLALEDPQLYESIPIQAIVRFPHRKYWQSLHCEVLATGGCSRAFLFLEVPSSRTRSGAQRLHANGPTITVKVIEDQSCATQSRCFALARHQADELPEAPRRDPCDVHRSRAEGRAGRANGGRHARPAGAPLAAASGARRAPCGGAGAPQRRARRPGVRTIDPNFESPMVGRFSPGGDADSPPVIAEK
jgi:hypothetical protein